MEAPREPKRGVRKFDLPTTERPGAVGKGREGVNPSPEIGIGFKTKRIGFLLEVLHASRHKASADILYIVYNI